MAERLKCNVSTTSRLDQHVEATGSVNDQPSCGQPCHYQQSRSTHYPDSKIHLQLTPTTAVDIRARREQVSAMTVPRLWV
ncbi:hypothetical protein RRG08_007262 [Elysia crispata]|uniref:Uncharacterized protein n=1 Tax=Elysia crispata TaxID=231223 RepID=A0AAE0ZST6_9GAST|nr:hypothetical protein RRG08_007262 [Elysia crispata]